MKLHATHVTSSPAVWSGYDIAAGVRSHGPAAAATTTDWSDDDSRAGIAERSALPKAVRIVGIMAFGQSLLFLAIFLFFCARAGAATEAKSAVFDPDLRISSYSPTKERDPFLSSSPPVVAAAAAAAAGTSVVPLVLKLQGILFQTDHPAAMINDRLVMLNKPIVLKAGQSEIEVQAVKITRELVVLQIGEQQVELRINSPEREQQVR